MDDFRTIARARRLQRLARPALGLRLRHGVCSSCGGVHARRHRRRCPPRSIQRIVARYGPDSAFHLVCGRRCHGKLCHGAVLAALFQQVTDSSEALPFPKELKPTVPEIMSDLSVLMHLSALTGIPVYQVVSDVKDFFNQHHLAPEEKHKVGLVTLDPRAIVEHADQLRRAEPALANIAENVLGYGLACASNICQRTAHLPVFVWLVEMQKAAAPVVAALRRRHPALRAWLDDRARLLEAAPSSSTFQSVRYSQSRLWSVSMYTDDGHQAILGPQLTVTGLRVWRKIMSELRLTMAIVQKHGIGQQGLRREALVRPALRAPTRSHQLPSGQLADGFTIVFMVTSVRYAMSGGPGTGGCAATAGAMGARGCPRRRAAPGTAAWPGIAGASKLSPRSSKCEHDTQSADAMHANHIQIW